MRKILKRLGLALLGLAGLALLLVLLHPLWIGLVARPVANAVVSATTGANFRLGELALNAYAGALQVGDVRLSNPTNGGFKVEENCVELGQLDVDVAMGTVLSDKIVIRSIVLDGLTVRTTLAGGNFQQIAENAGGGARDEDSTQAAAPGKEDEKKSSGGPRVQIDRIVLRNCTIRYGGVTIPIPTLTIESIGADESEGATFIDAVMAVWNKILASAGVVGGKLGELGAQAADAIGDRAAASAERLGKEAGKAAERLGKEAGKAADALRGIFGN
ncbi:MAG: hypothetical protein ACI4R9_04495 [Kiritimatiellia bacterium]